MSKLRARVEVGSSRAKFTVKALAAETGQLLWLKFVHRGELVSPLELL